LEEMLSLLSNQPAVKERIVLKFNEKTTSLLCSAIPATALVSPISPKPEKANFIFIFYWLVLFIQ
jgi:hypothetical protein